MAKRIISEERGRRKVTTSVSVQEIVELINFDALRCCIPLKQLEPPVGLVLFTHVKRGAWSHGRASQQGHGWDGTVAKQEIVAISVLMHGEAISGLRRGWCVIMGKFSFLQKICCLREFALVRLQWWRITSLITTMSYLRVAKFEWSNRRHSHP